VKKRSKRYQKAASMVEPGKRYSVADAVQLLGKFPKTKFDESVNVVVKVGIDSKKSDQVIRGAFSLPHGIGKSVSVLVFAEGEFAEAAKAAGADHVGSKDLADKVAGGWMEFDIAIAHPNMMRFVGKLGRVLGPQGKMPSPKAGTVVENVGQAVSEFKAGKIEFRNDAGGNLHALVGKRSFEPEKLAANVEAFLHHVQSMRPATAKGNFVVGAHLSAAMSPGIELAVA
jgi:large subunit ribosomal protein L1